ncbi:MAG: type 2 isopentenyl-diphosphate Delta-isomerase [Ignavibacteriaceae bacterium]|jgi:isopentenyl-diphosphate delta-isomerase
MTEQSKHIISRKKEHLELCKTDAVQFKEKTSGFEKYDFLHSTITEAQIDKIDLSKKFFGKKVTYPFLISCMTGGTTEGENINLQLAEVAADLNIPLGLGSLRFALETNDYDEHFKQIRKAAKAVPLLGNIGGAQIIKMKSFKTLFHLLDKVESDVLVVHLNPLQELLQKNGEPNFYGIKKSLEKLVKQSSMPIIVKEVGSGISKKSAQVLLDLGIAGIDIAGAGGTSWAGVEILRNKQSTENPFWDWGLPTSYCIKTVAELKKKNKFMLIGSGGINSSFDAAKALALGADFTASARIILQTLIKDQQAGVITLIKDWFEDVKQIMFLTDSQNLRSFGKEKLILKKDCY